jgi:hypothetical protein
MKAINFAPKYLIVGLLGVFFAIPMLELAVPKASALYQTGAKWPTNDIRVCWETGLDTRTSTGNRQPAFSVSNFATYSAWLQNAVESNWGMAGLRFTGWKDCPSRTDSELAGWVAIHWGSKNNTTIGYRTDTWTRMELILPSDTSEASRKSFQASVTTKWGTLWDSNTN